jgi:hypothetical protein
MYELLQPEQHQHLDEDFINFEETIWLLLSHMYEMLVIGEF